VLGPEALQSGSFNKPGYLRLDFAWGQSLSDETKSEIEEVSNLAIRSDLAVSAQFMSLPAAKDWGAIALFGETYDEQVRVVQVGGPWSRELCGGTHVSRTSQIGLVSVIGESSVGSGARRIEALVGIDAIHGLNSEREVVRRLSQTLKVPSDQLEERIDATLSELRETQRKLTELQAQAAQSMVPRLLAEATERANSKVISRVVEDVDAESLRSIAIGCRDQLGPSAVVILGSIIEGKPVVLVACGPAAIQQGIKAGDLAKSSAAILGGGGGGKPDLAQGGGVHSAKLGEAIHATANSF
jgi:alanyl-tRNA synthetase